MARINVEQKALTDSRFVKLGRLLLPASPKPNVERARWVALGAMLNVWNECQERGKCCLSGETLEDVTGVDGFGKLLVESDLARRQRHGFYIAGSRGRVEWLEKRRKDGQKGGRPPYNPRVLPKNNPPAPAPAPALKNKKTPPPPLLDVAERGCRPAVRSRRNGGPPGFEKWWAAYRQAIAPRPMRDKEKSRREWTAAKLEQHSEKLIRKLGAQVDYREAARDDGEFIPNLPDPIRYFKRKLWREEIPT